MTTRIATLLFVCFSGMLYAQLPFGGPGAVWNYGYYAPGLIKSRGIFRYSYDGDSLIQGKNAMAIREFHYRLDPDPPYAPFDTIYTKTIYRYLSNDSLMEWYNGDFHLQLKYNVVEGDTFTIRLGGRSLISVDSVRIETINNIPLKKYFVSGYDTGPLPLQIGNGVYYDKIGPEPGFYVQYCWNGGFDCYKPRLCHYKDDQFPASHFNGLVCMQNFTDVTEIVTPESVRVYPNPVDNFLFVESSTEAFQAIQLFDVLGQMVHTSNDVGNLSTEGLSVSSLPPGPYFFRLLAGKQWRLGRFLKN